MKHTRQILNIFFFIFIIFFYSSNYANANKSDSLIYGPTYEEIESNLIHLANEYPLIAKRIVYGNSLKSKNLNLIKISKIENDFELNRSRKAVYISGSTHGNEYLNIENSLPGYFLENYQNLFQLNKFLNDGGTIYIVPIFNPDGYEQRIRGNNHEKDLNRDFPLEKSNHVSFQEPETIALAKYLQDDLQKNNLKLVFTLDYHCCVPALIYPWSFPGTPMPENNLNLHRTIGNFVNEIFGYPMGDSMQIFKNGSGVGTSKDYFYETYHSLSFTFEGQRNIENQNFLMHLQLWEKVFEYLNGL